MPEINQLVTITAVELSRKHPHEITYFEKRKKGRIENIKMHSLRFSEAVALISKSEIFFFVIMCFGIKTCWCQRILINLLVNLRSKLFIRWMVFHAWRQLKLYLFSESYSCILWVETIRCAPDLFCTLCLLIIEVSDWLYSLFTIVWWFYVVTNIMKAQSVVWKLKSYGNGIAISWNNK